MYCMKVIVPHDVVRLYRTLKSTHYLKILLLSLERLETQPGIIRLEFNIPLAK